MILSLSFSRRRAGRLRGSAVYRKILYCGHGARSYGIPATIRISDQSAVVSQRRTSTHVIAGNTQRRRRRVLYGGRDHNNIIIVSASIAAALRIDSSARAFRRFSRLFPVAGRGDFAAGDGDASVGRLESRRVERSTVPRARACVCVCACACTVLPLQSSAAAVCRRCCRRRCPIVVVVVVRGESLNRHARQVHRRCRI
jgi:hypothetical protein